MSTPIRRLSPFVSSWASRIYGMQAPKRGRRGRQEGRTHRQEEDSAAAVTGIEVGEGVVVEAEVAGEDEVADEDDGDGMETDTKHM